MKRGSFILLVLSVGCGPHFENGKTQCSDQRECPSGFVCGSNGTSYVCFDNSIVRCPSGYFYCAQSASCATSLAACSTPQGGSGGTGGRTGGPAGGSTGTRADAGVACTDPAYPVRCDATGTYPGGCWATGVVCSTIANCSTNGLPDYTACGTVGYHPDCTGTCVPSSGVRDGGISTRADAGTCTDPDNPIYCAAIGTFPGGCWASGVVCSTIVNCGTSAAPEYSACGTAGYHPDCTGTKCLPNVGADAGVSTCPTPAAGGTCNVFPACGCPTGQACSPNTQATGLKCVPAGSLGEGADCTSGECASGFGCFGDVCKRYCQLDSDCPAVDSAHSCVQTNWSPGVEMLGVLVCVSVCDPVSPQNPRSPLSACPVGFGCSSWGTSLPGATDCEPQSGTGITGSACATDGDCVPGYYCSNGNVCVKYCYTVADCPTGTTCVSFSTPNYAGTTQVNHCHSP